MKPKARIEWVIDDDNKEGLWVIIDRGDGEGTMWAIEEDELLPIRTAIDEYIIRERKK